jgi:hypothetical protein
MRDGCGTTGIMIEGSVIGLSECGWRKVYRGGD